MRIEMNNSCLKFYIGDVRDYDSISQALKDVDYVYHAAALKQVPSCEFYPLGLCIMILQKTILHLLLLLIQYVVKLRIFSN